MNKETPKIKFGKIKGNVVISNNQNGGITTHTSYTDNIPTIKKKPFLKWPIWAYLAIISSVLTILGYFGFVYKPDKVPIKLPKQENIAKDTTLKRNKPPTINKKANHIFNRKKESKEPVTIGNVAGDVVISNNQTGGITAHTIIVPEDREIPLKDNYSATFTTFEGKQAIKICPKHGTWGKVFLIVPLDVFAESKVDLRNGNGLDFNYMMGDSYGIKPNGERFPTKVINIAGPCTSDLPFYITYETAPKVFYFGDPTNPDKQYKIESHTD